MVVDLESLGSRWAPPGCVSAHGVGVIRGVLGTGFLACQSYLSICAPGSKGDPPESALEDWSWLPLLAWTRRARKGQRRSSTGGSSLASAASAGVGVGKTLSTVTGAGSAERRVQVAAVRERR